MSIASWTSPPASASTLPISRLISSVSSSFCSSSRRGDEPPLLERRLRGVDGAVDVLGGRAREAPERLAGRRHERLEGLAGGGVGPLAADVVLELPLRDHHLGRSV